jgi:O-antigen ligase
VTPLPAPRVRPGLGVLAIAVLAALAALAGAAGITQHVAFQQPSPLKYAITIGGPLLVLLAVSVPRPLTVLAPIVIIAAPFGSFSAVFGGYTIPLMLPLLALAAVAICFDGDARADLTPLGLAGLLAVPLLLIPIKDGTQTHDFVESLVTLLAVAWVVSRTAREPGGIPLVIGAVLASALLQSALAIWEAKTGSRLNLYNGAGNQVFGDQYFYTFEDETRPVGSLFDPISLGNVLAIAGPLAVAAAARLRGTWRWIVLGAALIVTLALTLSLSRMAWIGFAVGGVVTIALLPKYDRRRIGLLAVVGLVVVAVVALAIGGSSLRTRFNSVGDPTSSKYTTGSGDQRRLDIWNAAIHVFAEHPIAGVGVGRLENEIQNRVANVGTYTHAHSTYFQLLGEDGLLGLALLAVFLAGLVVALRDVLRQDRVLGAGLIGASVALLICWTTDFVIVYSNVSGSIAVLLGLVAAAGRLARARRVPEPV